MKDSKMNRVMEVNLHRDLSNEISEVDKAHCALKRKVRKLVRKAGGDRSSIYNTTLCDGGSVSVIKPVFHDARLFEDRNRLTEYCAQLLIASGQDIECAVEVGVEYGDYSSFLADTLNPKVLRLFDIRFDLFRDMNSRSCIEQVEGDSANTLTNLPDNSVSFAYIDGDHGYKAVSADIDSILSKMKPNGIIQFNDYATFNLRFAAPYGVRAAVNNLLNTHKVSVVGYGLHSLGLDDIAVRVF